MAIAISSDPEFYIVIGDAVSNAISDVLDKIFQELRKAVERDIYDAYSSKGEGTYERTNELIDSWEVHARGLFGDLEFQPDMLSSDPLGFHHNSPYGWDVRNEILDILEGGYRAYNAKTGKPIPRRPMWDEFIAKVDSKFHSWMIKALRANGLDVI